MTGTLQQRAPAFFLLILLSFFISTAPTLYAQSDGQVQEILGRIEPNRGSIYRLPDLSAGDRLSIYAEADSGNLDPIIGLSDADLSGRVLREQFDGAVDQAISAGEDPLTAVPRIMDELFVAWDDDSGEGYAAALDFAVPRDGDYELVIAGTPSLETFGTFRMLVGLNIPGSVNPDTRPTGDIIAELEFDGSAVDAAVQEVSGTLSAESPSTFFQLTELRPGDTLYVFAEATSGDLRPTVILSDFGQKPVRSGNFTGTSSSTSFEYTFGDIATNYRIDVKACCEDAEQTSGDFRLLVGVNVPEVLTGEAVVTGQNLLGEPIVSQVGIEINQITGVDQRAENFGIVATLRMEWQDPELAFSPASCQCSFKVFLDNDFVDFATSNDISWPEFTLANQQGRRFTQNMYVVVWPTGDAEYFERFTATLQAPDFDFTRFPFDRQQFYVRIDSLFPEEYVVFSDLENQSGMGSQLGEEEWVVTDYQTIISSEDGNSRFSFRFDVKRHLNFYIFRILLPLLIIIAVSWFTFFLKDYGKRIDVAGANLLLFIAFNFTISGELPRLGYLTFLDTILIATFVITGLVLLLNVVLKRLEISGRGELAQKLDQFNVWLYPVSYVVAIVAISFLFT